MGKKIVFLLISLFFIWEINAQNTTIKGIVIDSITGEGLPYVSLIFKGTTIGTATDGDGNFSFSTVISARKLEVSYLGYDPKEVKIALGKTNDLKIQLAPNGIILNEVVIKPQKERYSKKENPAVEFVKQVIALRESNNPRNHDYFRYDQYEKMIFAMNDYTPKPKKNTKDDISVNFKLNEKTKGMYARRLNIYSNQSFEEPDAEQARIFKESAPVITLKEAYRQPEDFWTDNRPDEAAKKNPNSVKNLMAKLRSVPVFYVTEKVVSTLVSGYIATNKDPMIIERTVTVFG